MKDTWCKPILARTGSVVSGGAARNVRIAAAGGMDEIVVSVARHAARDALDRADDAVRDGRRAKLGLRLVANRR